MEVIGTYPKYYVIVMPDNNQQVVRRDIYWDSGFKSPQEIDLLKQIEAQLEQA